MNFKDMNLKTEILSELLDAEQFDKVLALSKEL